MTLYNCKSTPVREVYRITKFTTDLEVESSYLTGPKNCECPGYAKRNACRHGAIRAAFMTSGHVDDEWLLDFDTREWTRNPAAAQLDLATAKIVASELTHERSEESKGVTSEEREFASDEELATLPKGDSVISFDDPALMYKVIAEVIDEALSEAALGVGVSATPAPAPVVDAQSRAPTGVPLASLDGIRGDKVVDYKTGPSGLIRGRKL